MRYSAGGLVRKDLKLTNITFFWPLIGQVPVCDWMALATLLHAFPSDAGL